MIQQALRVVEAQQQRAHLVAAALVSKASNHAIGGPQALDLDHRALAAEIFFVQPLGDDPVSPVAIEIVEPLRRFVRSRVHGVTISLPAMAAFSPKASSALRRSVRGKAVDSRAVGRDQHVEKDQPRRRFLRQTTNSACRGMQPRLQCVKSHTPVQLDDQFAVDDKSLEWNVQQRRHNFGEKAAQGRPGFSP